ncbi:MAG: protein YgfX [Thiohalocapsa sp.]
MSDHHRQPPLTIRPVASMRLLVFVSLIHAIAFTALLPLPLPWGLKLALVVLIVGDLSYVVWARTLGRAPWSVVQATWSDTGWTLTTKSGRTQQFHLAPSTYIGVNLVIVNLSAGMFRRRSLVLTPDNIDPDHLRRLRARLRLASS